MSMTNLIAASPPSSLFYSRRIAEEITSQHRYVDNNVKATLTSGYIMASSDDDYEDIVLAKLGPLERWQYLAKYNRVEFIVWLIALLGGTIMLIAAGIHLGVSIISAALAQNAPSAVAGSAHDLFDWAIAGLWVSAFYGV